MNVAHILPGWPWLYERSVTHYGKQNNYLFMYNRPNDTLCPSKPREIPSAKVKVYSVPTQLTKSLHALKKSEFERSAFEFKIVYMLVAREVRDAPIEMCS